MAIPMTLITDNCSPNTSKTIIRPECRVCLKKDGILPIFGDKANPDISLEISMFGGIQLEENDEFPKLICKDCFKLLECAILFRKSAKRTDAVLRRRKKKNVSYAQSCTSIKIEKVEFEVSALAPLHLQSGEKTNEALNPKSNGPQDGTKIDFVAVEMDENISLLRQEDFFDEPVHEDHEFGEINGFNEVIANAPEIIKKSNLSFDCKYCSVQFESSDKYEEHRSTVEHKRNYIISFMPKKKIAKLSHQGKKTANHKDNFCELCNRVFTKVHFSRHMLIEHKIKLKNTSHSVSKKECTDCKKMFHPAALSNHMKRIHGNGNDVKPKIKLECPICKKLFSRHFYPLHLQRHKQGDTKDYVCDQCGKKFFFKSSFFTHRLIHSNVLAHKCEYCPYRGRTKELLKIHVRTHTGNYPYKCTECDTRCSTKSNLNSHVRRHRGPVDFICDACSRGFYSKIQLERHISVSHYGVKNHICSICGTAFGYRHGLMSHLRKVHKRPKGLGKPKAVYLQLQEEGLLPPEPQQEV